MTRQYDAPSREDRIGEREALERKLLLYCVAKLVDDTTGDGALRSAVARAFRELDSRFGGADADLEGHSDGGDEADAATMVERGMAR